MTSSTFLHLVRSTSRDFAICLSALGLFTWLVSLFTAPGITNYFMSRVWEALLPAAALCLAAYLVMRRFEFDEPTDSQNRSALDAVFLLLPLTPVTQYVVLNSDILSLGGSAAIIILFGSLSFVLSKLVPDLLSRWVSVPASRSILLSFLFVVLYMPALALEQAWHLRGDGVIQVSIFFGLAAIIWIFHQVNSRLLLVVIIAYFASNTAMVGLANLNKSSEIHGDYELIDVKKSPRYRPNIYMLTYDSYVENQTMLNYGLDNSEQEQYLESLGFTIYRGIYSLGGASRVSMGSVLGLSDYSGAAGGNGKIVRLLKSIGYETHGIFRDDYFFQDGGAHYDNVFPGDSSLATHWIITRAILEGEFRFNAFYDKPSDEEFLKAKEISLVKKDSRPQFVYTHTGPDHSQNSGKCLANEVELFERRLSLANIEMRNDLTRVLSNHPNSIIVVNGDHGPYLTKNCTLLNSERFDIESIGREDIQDRFGAFLAIRWPADLSMGHGAEIEILQDIFPVILDSIFEDPSFLDMRLDPTLFPEESRRIAGASVDDGIIRGGQNDGEPLYQDHVE